MLEDTNIESLNVPQVRSRMGIVSQEPVLFDRTLGDNIRFLAFEPKLVLKEQQEEDVDSKLFQLR